VSYRCGCTHCQGPAYPQSSAYVIEDQRDTNAYVAPALSMENAKEAIAAWPFKDQETLYRWLHTLKCRM
jgi:hypothetical protein